MSPTVPEGESNLNQEDMIVLGLEYSITKEELKAYFEQFGVVTHCEVGEACSYSVLDTTGWSQTTVENYSILLNMKKKQKKQKKTRQLCLGAAEVHRGYCFPL